MTDRTAKALLVAIAIGVWLNALAQVSASTVTEDLARDVAAMADKIAP
jgi:hypothetical protein